MAYDGTLKFDTAIDAGGFQKGIDGIGSIAAKGMQATGAILMGAASAIGAMGAAAVKVGADFEGAMSKVEAISGATGSDLEALTNKAKEMGASTKFSATESANAFEYMAMAGWKTGDMLNGIEGIMNLAAASGEDLATTSDIVTDALTAFGMTAGDATHFADVLATASSNANTNVGMMGETFKYVAPVAGALGYTAEDTAVAIGLMANAGIKSSQAGTSLRSMMSRLTKPTKEVQVAMDALGVSLTNSDGTMKTLNRVMLDLREGFAGLSEAEAAQMASSLAGQEAMSGLLAIVNASDEDFNKLSRSVSYASIDIDGITEAVKKSGVEWEKYSDQAFAAGNFLDGVIDDIVYNLTEAGTSVEELQEYLQSEWEMSAEDAARAIDTVASSLDNTTGSAERMAQTMNDNLQGQITILKSGLEGLGVSLYESVQTPLKDIAIEAQGMVRQLQDGFNESGLEGMVTAFGDILAQIVERVAGAAPDLIDAAVGLVGSFCESLKSSPSIGDAASGLITTLVTGLFSCADDIWTTAIVLAGKMADGLAEGAPQMARAAARCMGDIIECLREWAPDFIDAGKRIIEGIIQGIGEEFPSLGAFLGGLFEGFTSTLEPILGGVISVVQGIFDSLAGADPAVMEALGKGLGTIAAAIITMSAAKAAAGNIKMAVSAISSFAGHIKTAVGVVPKLVEGFQLLSGGAGTFSEVLALEFPKVAAAFSKMGSMFSVVKSVIVSIGPTVAGIAGVIGGSIMAVTSFFDMLQDGFSWVKEALMVVGVALAAVGAVILGAPAAVAAAVAGIVAAVATLIVVIKDHWDQIAEFFTGIGTSIVEFFAGIPGAVGGVVDSIVESFAGLPGKIGTWLVEVVNGIITWGAEMLTAAGQAASDIISGVVDFFAGLPDQIAYWLGYAIGTVIKWGIDLYTWVTTEIPNIIQSVVNFFALLPGKVWTWLVDTVNRVIQWGINLKNTAETWVTNTINSVVNFFSTLPGKVWTWLVDTVNRAVQWGINLLSAASTAAQDAVNKVTEWFSQLPGKVWSWLSNTISKVTQFGSDMGSKASEAAKGFVTKLTDGLAGLPGQMASIGSNIVNGIWSGISDGWNWLIGKVKGLANSLYEGAKDALGINSPSRVFALEVGQWIPPGIGVGIDKAMPDLHRQVDAEMLELAGRMQTAVAIETGGITVRTKASAEHRANTEYPQGGGDTYIDQHVEQENNYHVPVVTPSETSRANREAARNLLGGVK